MAIKIIKASPSGAVKRRVVCRSCGVALEYVPADVRSRTYREIDQSDGCTKWINCPQCKSEIIVGGY